MKVVLNKCFGGFSIADWAVREIGILDEDDVEACRQDKKLIQLIEAEGSAEVSGPYANLKIVEVPDEATDWKIAEYDGFESVTYVLDGKIHHI